MQLIWGLVVLAVWVATTCYRLVRLCLVGTAKLASMLARRRRDSDRAMAPSQEAAVHSMPARPMPVDAVMVAEAHDRFAPADRIYHVAFSRGFTAKVYVYKARGEVRRVLSTTDAVLSRNMEYALMSTRIPLTTLSLREHSIEAILRDTEVKGWEAINKTIESLRSIRQFELAEAPCAPAAEMAAISAQEVPAAQATAGPLQTADAVPLPEAAAGLPQPEAPGAAVSSRTARKGVAITGIVIEAQNKEALFNGAGRKSKGTTFEVTLETAHGETSMRGVELRDECTRLGVKTGDRVSITPLGRQRVVSGENDKGFMKNLFKVELLERAAA